MANPQQPELARSRKTPSQDQDSVAGLVEARREVGADAPRGPIPPENQPGNHPEQEQDKPDLDSFAQRFGIVEDGPAGDGEAGTEGQGIRSAARSSKSAAFAIGAALLSALVVALGLLVGRKRRRSR